MKRRATRFTVLRDTIYYTFVCIRKGEYAVRLKKGTDVLATARFTINYTYPKMHGKIDEEYEADIKEIIRDYNSLIKRLIPEEKRKTKIA